MESEESDITDDQHKSEQISAFLVQVLKDNQVLLEKAQVANSKTIKRQAIEIIRDKYESKFREKINTQQILKKISNMKWRTKYKVNLNKSGCRNYVLKDWEKELLELLELENTTSATTTSVNKPQLPGQQNFGVFTIKNNNSDNKNSLQLQGVGDDVCHPSLESSVYIMEPPSKKNKMSNNTRSADIIISKYETDETSQLTDAQLQRLILLKQNHVLNKKLNMLQVFGVHQQQPQHQQQHQQQTHNIHPHHQQPQILAPPPPPTCIRGLGNGDIAMEIKSRNLSFDEF